MSIDYTEPLGQVRLLITDVAEEPAEQLFNDEQLKAFLTMCGDNVNRAAARALLVMAASEVMVSKVIRTQDRSTDGAKVSAELRALAGVLAEAADTEDAATDGPFFDVVPFYPGPGPEGGEYRRW
jgi:hypothetical protein